MTLINKDLSLLLEELASYKSVETATQFLYSIYPPSKLLREAVDFCVSSHDGQFRKSGEPYATHPILVAAIVAFFSPRDPMLIAALLHDVIEDTPCTEEEMKERFGQEITNIINGLTKIVSIRDDNLPSSASKAKISKSALNFRNLLLASIDDISVLLIKLCDRLHNMSTLDFLRPDKQKRIAEETLVVYAPIAHRLGISSIKNLLEDLSFKYLLPDEYNQINNFLNSHDQSIQLGLNSFIAQVEILLLNSGFTHESFEITKRVKHSYSIYLKMQRKGIGIEEVLDLLGIRILVNTVEECYVALGVLHTNFTPLISRFKDYVALPKQNGYQTIHTSIFDSKNIIEVQIRTFSMHKTAEYGVAAHWKYKEQGSELSPSLEWIDDISAKARENVDEEDAIKLYEYAKGSLFIEDIGVYSPKGDIFTLPKGATALDYAYEVHSKVGLHASEALINKIPSPLLTVLNNGDIVEIITKDEKFFRCSWIDSVKTAKAKQNIDDFCKQKIKELDTKSSLNILATVFLAPHEEIAKWLDEENLTNKVRMIVKDPQYFKDVINALRKHGNKFYWLDKYALKELKFDHFLVYSNHKLTNVDLEHCCHPKRYDEIVAFREANTVTVHHKLCKKAMKLVEEGAPMVFICWQHTSIKTYKLIVSLENKRGRLAEFLLALAKMQINVLNITLNASNPAIYDYFEVVVELPANIAVSSMKERLKDKYKIVELVSLDDAYNEKG